MEVELIWNVCQVNFFSPTEAEPESSRPVQTAVTWPVSEPPSASTPASPSEPEEEQSPLELENITLSLSQTSTDAERSEKEITEGPEEDEMVNVQEEEKKDEEPERNCEDEAGRTGAEERRQMIDDSVTLSEKERQNEELNEKDNCSASSISSASSTLEREEREEKLVGDSGKTFGARRCKCSPYGHIDSILFVFRPVDGLYEHRGRH